MYITTLDRLFSSHLLGKVKDMYMYLPLKYACSGCLWFLEYIDKVFNNSYFGELKTISCSAGMFVNVGHDPLEILANTLVCDLH